MLSWDKLRSSVTSHRDTDRFHTFGPYILGVGVILGPIIYYYLIFLSIITLTCISQFTLSSWVLCIYDLSITCTLYIKAIMQSSCRCTLSPRGIHLPNEWRGMPAHWGHRSSAQSSSKYSHNGAQTRGSQSHLQHASGTCKYHSIFMKISVLLCIIHGVLEG